MDKRNSKKQEQTKPDKKDRGDNLKKVEKVVKKLLDSVEQVKSHYPGGDTDRKPKVDKPRVIVFRKPDDVKLKIIDHRASKENVTKKFDKEESVKDKDERKKIRDKYTLKLKAPVVGPVVKKEEVPKLNVKLPVVESKIDKPPKKLTEIKSKIDTSTELDSEHIKDKKKETVHRKPLIKTVTAKNDTTKVFKAVTFVDQKVKSTMLQIKIPNDVKNPKKNVETNTAVKKVKATVSRVSVKEKPIGSRRKSNKNSKSGRRRHQTSPDLSVKIRSPPTEVAKWAPSSINRHTKPYYEAWVSTTLAAISKNSRKDRLFLEKQNILQSFQRALAERPETPELVYENFADEKYTGRIKVKQRS